MPLPWQLLRSQRASWCLLLMLAMVLYLLLRGTLVTQMVDQSILDRWQGLQALSPAGGYQSPVLIIDIDQRSLDKLGPWPWPENLQAKLIDRALQAQARAIGFSIALPRLRMMRDETMEQTLFHWGPRVVLPVGSWDMVPYHRRAQLELQPDPDGVLRRVHLYAGPEGGVRWQHLALAVLEAARLDLPQGTWHWVSQDNFRGFAGVDMDGSIAAGTGWLRDSTIGIAYGRNSNGHEHVSFIDVLDGTIPDSLLRDRVVLVGATAAGLAVPLRVPLDAANGRLQPVEIVADAIDSLLSGNLITPLSSGMQWGLELGLLALLLLIMYRLSPVGSLLMWPLAIAALLLLSACLQSLYGFAWGPTVVIAVYSIVAIGWTMRGMIGPLTLVLQSGNLLGVTQARPATGSLLFSWRLKDLDASLRRLRQALAEQRSSYHLMVDALNNLPDAAMVYDLALKVSLANQQAARLFGVAAPAELEGRHIENCLCPLATTPEIAADLLQRLAAFPSAQEQFELQDIQGRNLVIKQAPVFAASGAISGAVLMLMDVSCQRSEQRQRDDALYFLSHDLREPQASSLALLGLMRYQPDAMPLAVLIERLERHTRRALALAEGFIQLQRAQSASFQVDRHDLAAMLAECVDDLWEFAGQAEVKLLCADSAEVAEVLIDREMVARAISNLLSNAIKFSPANSTVECRVEVLGAECIVVVRDHGIGMSHETLLHIFRPFYRSATESRANGAGLGLPMVKTVAERHGGTIRVWSELDRGSEFRLSLPLAATREVVAIGGTK
ncbi:CHASE2 domain-containing protein [Vogesella sp. LIG4]|uniref:CHASE2 domain-containing protein n=1 Tax=Vogesella sp. LIG4 TaxID=1192162 RepID=UPI00081F8291|nr:CHASE2 domain-containing protein [Vogesella sp. LIG4]SCK30942.1 PAS fold [Vogesella sp. LIG4]